jgi:hypothetical protein
MFRTLLRGFGAAGLGLAIVCGSLVAQDSAKPITPFNGKDLTGWKLKGGEANSRWKVGVAKLDETNNRQLNLADAPGPDKAELVNAKTGGGGVDIYTEEKFGDCTIIVELMVPRGSNSGIYVAGEYEIQVLDSFGKSDAQVGPGDIGGLYGAAKPAKNAAKAPGEWQKFEIVFQAPKFEGDKKIANAKFVKVVLNGVTIHENVEMKGVTPTGVTGKEAPTGPLMFQGDHGPVAYRNIQIIPTK